ncbi:NADH-quinone oxidoreductase subunit NuoB [Acidicapsa ligni]|uniref:NADH-quinone oxidoreductase subunit NuoB n=1 Tax=Acidicapsa ligni TaxID=542300 RepID=UPI0021E0C6AB|nr:NADH-quinone oxidoreductase subunit NuoB [Acidicapsa ligni]
MPVWTLFGLKHGIATNSWPDNGGTDEQTGVLGLPRLEPDRCEENCKACVEVCLPGAIGMNSSEDGDRLTIDYGKCIACQLCTESCPNEVLTKSNDWAFGVGNRKDLIWAETLASEPAQELSENIKKYFGRSLHIRHVDAGSCNGCESELQALNNPYYNLHRLGIFFTPSPRFADLLLVTGSVTYAMHEPLLATYHAMPEPRWVMATGTCAVSGGVTGGGYSGGNGLDGVLPVDLYVPGCPPNPSAMIQAILLLLNRSKQHVYGGHYAK